MSDKSNLAEKLILFAAFIVFAGLIVAFVMKQSYVEVDDSSSVSGLQFKTSSKTSVVTDPSGEHDQIGVVNINTATAEELMTLPNIGEKKAQAIIDHREQNGPFMTVEDILEVSGIGEATLAKIRDRISVE